MKKLPMILAGVALALTGGAASAKTAAERGEAKLAKMIEGRVAGEPVKCINALRSNSIRVIEHVGVVYDAGSTIYVARARNPNALGPMDVLVVERFGSQLCTNDTLRTRDRYAGFITGPVFLEDFVPYTRAG